MSKKRTGAQIVLDCLEREGVKHIFGYPGGVVLDIYDELTRRPDIQHFLCATNRPRRWPRTAMPGPRTRWRWPW